MLSIHKIDKNLTELKQRSKIDLFLVRKYVELVVIKYQWLTMMERLERMWKEVVISFT